LRKIPQWRRGNLPMRNLPNVSIIAATDLKFRGISLARHQLAAAPSRSAQ